MRPEHTLQVATIKLAGLVIDAPFRIRAFDRSRDFSGMQHMAEATRGVRTGTPDTEVICTGLSVNVEIKAPGTKHLKSHQPTEAQEKEMALLRAAGAYAGCAWSLVEVVQHWRAAGVPLRPNANLVALDLDLKVQTRIERAAAKPKAVRRAKPVRHSVAKMARIYAIRSRVPF